MAQTVKNKQILITSDFDINSHKLINVVNPTNNQDVATKYYVDSVAQGVSPHEPVRVISTGQTTLSGVQTVDGINLVNGNFILIAGQADKTQNGIYVVNSGGSWTRRPDADGNPSNEIELGDFVFIETGTTNASSGWVLSKTNATGSTITPDVNTQEWYKMSAPGSYVASGIGIELIGNMFTISGEISTRTSSDNLLFGAISTEVSNRIVADSLLSSAISTETSSKTSGDQSLSIALSTTVSTEVSTRTSADASLSTQISTNTSTDTSVRQSLSSGLSTEVSTRTSATASLSTLISTNTSTDTSTHQSLSSGLSTELSTRSTAISTEISSRTASDQSLSTAISTEVSGRTSGDLSLSTQISQMSGATMNLSTIMGEGQVLGISGGNLTGITYTMIESSLSTVVSTEISTRTTGDQSLSTTVSTANSTRLSSDQSLSTTISTEISTRGAADSSLSTLISTSTSTDTSTHQSLSSGISTEVSTRTSVGLSLSTSISNEISDRISGDESLSTSISAISGNTFEVDSILDNGEVLGMIGGELTGITYSTIVLSETSSRISVEASLSTLISTNTSTDTSVHQSLSVGISTEVSTRTSVDSSLSTLLSTETSARTNVDSSLSTSITTETSARTNADSSLSTSVSIESSTRNIADTSLSVSISSVSGTIPSLSTSIASLSTSISGGSVTTLSQLTDVSLSGLISDDLLIYDSISSKWKNIPVSDISVPPAILHTTTGITSNSSLGVLDSGLTLGMVYITNTGTVEANVNLGTTTTGTEINPYGIVPVPSGETLSITVNRRLSDTESKTLYISSSNWTSVILKVEWAEITYLNQFSSGGYELLSTTLSSEISTRSSNDNLLLGAISTEVSNRSVADGLLSTAISTEVSTRTSVDSSLSTSINNKGGVTWSVVTTDGSLVVNKGILANKGTLLTLTLPTSSLIGDVIRVAGMNAGLWKIAQNANQYVKFGTSSTTIGVSGYLASVATYDVVEMVCLEANLGWVVVSSIGNIDVV